MVHLRSRGADPAVWSYDSELSAAYTDILCDICDNGLTLGGRRALITGCGRGSIGAEVLKGLLEAGAQVVATTSSYSAKTTRYFQNLYQTHGSRGSSLTILPFNQASRQDVTNLVDYIYSDRGLNWDLDFVLPFAAIPELGHDVTELDAQSELSHRAMLTNVMRLLGAIASCKQQRRLKMHPTLAILPLSPNHGSFGYDGHYSESKLGLETLLNRWHSEPTWSEYVSVAGAVIGWTRGTGLMSGNNVVAEFVERTGVRTFSAAEMAFNILGLLHSRAYSMAAQSPIWADLAGRFQYYPQITQAVIELHQALAHMHDTLKTVTADSLADFGLVADDTVERVYNLRTVTKRANHKFQFPQIKSYDELDHLRHLQGMINLDQVVVVTGYGEVGPYGNAETRWEMEAFGEFSLEGCIELAWIMGYIKHFNGRLKTKQLYSGWVDAKTEEPIDDKHVKQRYEKQILEHTGIRLIEPELLDGYDPNCKTMLRELQIEHDMEPFEATEDEAQQFKLRNGDRVHIWEHAGSWQVRLLKGATLMVPKALRFDRLVAAQLPTGWSPERYGIPRSIADQVDPITCYALVATTEALVRSGITDPYELYKYVHVSEVGSSTGTALGGLRSTKRVFAERLQDKDQQPDVYQETFLSTPPAWINMLLMSASGPIKTTIGACATGVASIDVAVDTIQSGKAKIMLAGGTDALCEESSYEFAQMNATSSTISELEQGRTPREMSRPCTTTRNGFMESEGAGIVTLMSAATAIELGAPIYGIVAMTSTATDKEGRSVPAPGKGVLTSAREAPGAKPASSLPILDIEYRRRQLQLRQLQIREWACQERELLSSDQHAFIDAEAKRQQQEALDTWGNNFWKRNPHISPLRGALAAWGLTVDDIAVASFHGTSTKANDKNESEIIERQFRHLGRTPGNVVFSVCQKYLTGHPKGPASIWMLNGVLQMLRTGIVPGNRNADNISAELEDCQFIVYPSRSIRTPGIKAALLKSFGFGQVGGECLMVHPDYLYAVLDQQQLESYASRVAERETRAYRYWHDTLTDNHPFVQVKTEPPYSAEDEEALYLDPLARIH
ncbi:fatty acid synthase alpha subunit Lsd1 [Coemansia sp. RSA 2706]|nr:fatty acid synthase alpha subunit Lsd1 [Coemansia sp. RSA 2706]